MWDVCRRATINEVSAGQHDKKQNDDSLECAQGLKAYLK